MASTVTPINCGEELLQCCAFYIEIHYSATFDDELRLSLCELVEDWSIGLGGFLPPRARVSGTIGSFVARLSVVGESPVEADGLIANLLEWSRIHCRYKIMINDLGAPDYEPLTDWTKVDIDSIALQFIKSNKQELRAFKQAVRKKLTELIKSNPSREELRHEFETILEPKTRRQHVKIADFLRTLVAESNRARLEGLSEGELAVFDILAEENLPSADGPEGKEGLKKLAKLLFEQLLVLDPHGHQDGTMRVIWKLAELIEVNWPNWVGEFKDDDIRAVDYAEALLGILPWPVKDDREVIRRDDATKLDLVEEWPWLPAKDKDRNLSAEFGD